MTVIYIILSLLVIVYFVMKFCFAGISSALINNRIAKGSLDAIYDRIIIKSVILSIACDLFSIVLITSASNLLFDYYDRSLIIFLMFFIFSFIIYGIVCFIFVLKKAELNTKQRIVSSIVMSAITSAGIIFILWLGLLIFWFL